MAGPDNPWTTLSSRRLYDGGWIALDDDRVRDAAGQESPYAVARSRRNSWPASRH